MNEKTYKYDVFISYCHAELDSAVAAFLQKALERYRVPKEIQRKTGKKKISRVFRDKEELSVSPDLEQEIREQIYNSEFLVVVCSPNAVASPWVAKEINAFLETHSRDKIIPVLIEGSPQESFPSQLLAGAEHGAADVKASDINTVLKNTKRELPRIVAPILGCTYAELVQRQKVYRIRRLMSFVSVITAASVAFGVITMHQNRKISENYEKAVANQTKYLDRVSRIETENEQSIKSIQLALAAIPNNLKNEQVTADAEYTLASALGAYYSPGVAMPQNIWQFKTKKAVEEMFVSKDQTRLFIMDLNYNVYIWNLTGDYEQIYMRKNKDGESVWIVPADDDLFVISSDSIDRIDGKTGEICWSRKEEGFTGNWVHAQYLHTMDCIVTASVNGESLLFVDGETGKLFREVNMPKLPDEEKSFDSTCLTVSEDEAHIGIVDDWFKDDDSNTHVFSVLNYNILTGKTTISGVYPMQFVLDYCFSGDGLIVKGTDYNDPGGSSMGIGNMAYITTEKKVIYKFDVTTGELSWSKQENYFDVISSAKLKSADAFIHNEHKRIILYAFSNRLELLDDETGDVISEYELPAPIVNTKIIGDTYAEFFLNDGKVAHISYDRANAYKVTSSYVSGISKAEVFSDRDGQQYPLIVTGEDNKTIQLYTDSYYDENYQAFSNQTSREKLPEESVITGQYLVLLYKENDSQFLLDVYDVDSCQFIDSIQMEGDLEDYKVLRDNTDEDHLFFVRKCGERTEQKLEAIAVGLNGGKKKTVPLENENISLTFTGPQWPEQNCMIYDHVLYYGYRASSIGDDRLLVCNTYNFDEETSSHLIVSTENSQSISGSIEKWQSNIDASQFLICNRDYEDEVKYRYNICNHDMEVLGEVFAGDTEITAIWDENNNLAGIYNQNMISILDDKHKTVGSIDLEGEHITTACVCKDYVYYLTDSLKLCCYGLRENKLINTIPLDKTKISYSFVNENWEFDGNDIILNQDMFTYIIDTKDHQIRSKVPYSLGYSTEYERFITLNTEDNQIGWYDRYSIQDLIKMGERFVRGLSLSEEEKEQYGLE